MIENFASPAECAAVNNLAEPTLHRATVADSNGSSTYSENRKAMQSSVTVDYSSADDDGKGGNPTMTDMQLSARLARRILSYTNDHTDFNLQSAGQEDLMSIQYKGQGLNSLSPPDRYMPHCDGDCEGDVYRVGSRVATVVIYCKVPEVGGQTNFARANVHIVPEVGSATFFKYVGREGSLPKRIAMEMMAEGNNGTAAAALRMTDDGFTQHSGCPVFEGEKKIITMWMRMGVDAENTWDSYNTMGVKKSEADKFIKKNKMKAKKGVVPKKGMTSTKNGAAADVRTEEEGSSSEDSEGQAESQAAGGGSLMNSLADKIKSLF